jgi:transposase InsO family protein
LLKKPVKDWDYYYFRPHQIHLPKKWSFLRSLGKEQLTSAAQLKLEWIIFYYTLGNKKVLPTARHFGITRKTLHKWLKRFDETYLPSLEEHSRAPEKTRQRDISSLQRERIRKLRNKHIRWGKMKLRKLYKKLYGEYVSSWKFQIVIEEEQLYHSKQSVQRQKEKRNQARKQAKKRITTLKKEKQVHYLWHVDTVVFTMSHGGYRYLLTAIDDTSKLAYARLYTTHSSKQAADFLKRLHYLTEGEIINLHHDNGSEFMLNFEKACKELSLPQYYSRVRTPKDNAVLERFNRTIQEECIDLLKVGLEDIEEVNECLTDWLIEYNSVRPHQALDYQTPLEYIDTILSPMSSSSTAS